MERVSHRWYLTLHAWLDEQWNEPSRTDHYLMQLARLLKCLISIIPRFSKAKPNFDQFTHDECAISFTAKREREAKTLPISERRKRAAAIAKAAWFGITGYKRK